MKRSAIFLLSCVLLITLTGGAVAQEMDTGTWSSTFSPTLVAEEVGLGGVTGAVTFDSSYGSLFINLIPNGAELPEGTVLEGWLVAEACSLSKFSYCVADELYGPGFGDPGLNVLASAAPYALSTGVLLEDEAGNWSLDYHIPNYNFSPYDGVVITAESDGNSGDWDPRPGTPVFSAGMNPEYADLEKVEFEVFGMIGPAKMVVEGASFGIQFAELVGIANTDVTPLAANAGLEMAVAGATLYQSPYGAFIDLNIYLTGSPGPEGCLVLEGWVVDAGLLGGPGVSNASDADEVWGTSFDDFVLNAAVEAAPYALSTGVAADNGDGTLSSSSFIPGYNLDPYDAFVVTLESDCNDHGFDPRPGTPVLLGMIEREGEVIEGMRAARQEQSGG